MLKRQRHQRSNNRINRNYHQNSRHNNALLEEHMKDSERLDYRPPRNRITLQQYVEKYTTQARDAASSGDRILSENYLQYADHFSRLLNEQNQIRQQIEQKKQQKEQAIIDDIGTVKTPKENKSEEKQQDSVADEPKIDNELVEQKKEKEIQEQPVQKPKRKVVRKKKVETADKEAKLDDEKPSE